MLINVKKIVRFILLACVFSLMLGIPVLAAKIGVPQNLRWDGTTACWDEVEDAYQYQVVLYKDGSKLDYTIRTSSTSINLSGRMKKRGKYTFQVRVKDRISDEYGRYSTKSGTYEQERTINTTRRKTNSTTPGKEAGEKNPGPAVVGQNWRQNEQGWWYDNGDGSYLSGGWYQVGQEWYYFNAGGYLQTGWLTIDGVQYYCYSDGIRVTGWAEIDGGYYYFNENGVYNPEVKN